MAITNEESRGGLVGPNNAPPPSYLNVARKAGNGRRRAALALLIDVFNLKRGGLEKNREKGVTSSDKILVVEGRGLGFFGVFLYLFGGGM